jgi:hypothetical protein
LHGEEGESEKSEILIDLNKSPFELNDKELKKKWWMEPFVRTA